MKGWKGQTLRHSNAKRLGRAGPHYKIRHDSMGVKVRNTYFAKDIDAGLADVLTKINKAGFKTAQSMSGLKEDYQGKAKDRYSPDGYIGFWKSDLKSGQEEKIRQAAKKANLPVYDSKIYFDDAVTVRSGITKSGKWQDDLRMEAGWLTIKRMKLKESELKKPIHDYLGADREGEPPYPEDRNLFLKFIDMRDKIEDELTKQNGGNIDDEEIKKRWNIFAQELSEA